MDQSVPGKQPADPAPEPDRDGESESDGGKGSIGAASLDQAEFETLYRQSRAALWCVAAGMLGDRTQAEDVVHDAVLIAYERREQFVRGTNFVAWVGRIVRNVALNARRRKTEQSMPDIETTEHAMLHRVHRNGELADDERLPMTARGDLKPDQTAFDDRVVAALMKLTPQARACLLLRTLLDMPYAEIAQALDLPPGTAMSHVHRSRKLLHSMVLDEDAQPHRGIKDP
jgi:RNA polymerase sigma-70 factor, ECF subfamily